MQEDTFQVASERFTLADRDYQAQRQTVSLLDTRRQSVVEEVNQRNDEYVALQIDCERRLAEAAARVNDRRRELGEITHDLTAANEELNALNARRATAREDLLKLVPA